MKKLSEKELVNFIEPNVQAFHDRRIENLNRLNLTTVLKRKNPYLFKAKNIQTAQDLVKSILDAHLSSQEEAIFGEFLESLAIFVCHQTLDGRKSTAEGIDLEFEDRQIRYIISIKSGPNWGNSQQISRMVDNFKRAKKVLSADKSIKNIIAVNGCCYGRDDHPDKGHYLKLCGQRFWEFISKDENLYVTIIEPLGHRAKEKNEYFYDHYAQVLNKFTHEFIDRFCADGRIVWDKLVEFNSAKII